MDEIKENPQEDHFLSDVDIATVAERSGVESFHFEPEKARADNEDPQLVQIKKDRGFELKAFLFVYSF